MVYFTIIGALIILDVVLFLFFSKRASILKAGGKYAKLRLAMAILFSISSLLVVCDVVTMACNHCVTYRLLYSTVPMAIMSCVFIHHYRYYSTKVKENSSEE